LGIFFLSRHFGVYSAAIGVVIGSVLHVAVQIPTLIHLGYVPKFSLGEEMKGVWEMIRLMPPRALALGLDQVERWVAVNLASSLVSGSLSIFTFARQLYVLPISLFGVSLSQATFPTLASDAAKPDKTQFISTLTKSLMQIFFFALPSSILILVLRIPLVRIAFGARSFPWDATLETAQALAYLSLSIAPQAATLTLTRSLHALKDTKTSLYIGFYTMVSFVLIAKGFGYLYGNSILWICLALSLSNLFDFFLTYFAVRKKIGKLDIFPRLSKIFIITLITGFSLWAPMRLLDQFVFDTTRTVPLILLTVVVGLVGFGVYYLLCHLFAVEEIADVNQILKKLGNWRKILASSDEVIDPSTSSHT
jgi:putative peptidoglycan lipid II flippase